MLSHFKQVLSRVSPPRILVVEPRQPVIVSPQRSRAILVEPMGIITVQSTSPIIVLPPKRGVWEEKGWILEFSSGQQVYRGYFQVTERWSKNRQCFSGRIEVTRSEVIPYISDPPPGIRTHPKGPCFSHTENGWFRVHWYHPAKNVDDTILYIEKILDDVIN